MGKNARDYSDDERPERFQPKKPCISLYDKVQECLEEWKETQAREVELRRQTVIVMSRYIAQELEGEDDLPTKIQAVLAMYPVMRSNFGAETSDVECVKLAIDGVKKLLYE